MDLFNLRGQRRHCTRLPVLQLTHFVAKTFDGSVASCLAHILFHLLEQSCNFSNSLLGKVKILSHLLGLVKHIPPEVEFETKFLDRCALLLARGVDLLHHRTQARRHEFLDVLKSGFEGLELIERRPSKSISRILCSRSSS